MVIFIVILLNDGWLCPEGLPMGSARGIRVHNHSWRCDVAIRGCNIVFKSKNGPFSRTIPLICNYHYQSLLENWIISGQLDMDYWWLLDNWIPLSLIFRWYPYSPILHPDSLRYRKRGNWQSSIEAISVSWSSNGIPPIIPDDSDVCV